MTEQQKLKRCAGCRNDFYNGNNPLKVKRCWSLDDARIVWKKEVHVNQMPPWNQSAKRVLSCFHRDRYVYVDPKQTH